MDGLEIIKSMEEDDNDKGSMASSAQGTKFDRLPAIVGSKLFKDEDFLGIIEKLEEPQIDFNMGMNSQPGMNQSTNLNQSQQQINQGNPTLSIPNIDLGQPQNNSSNSLQPPPLLNILQQHPGSSNGPQINTQSTNFLPPPNLNPSGSGGSGLLPPPSLGLLLAQKEGIPLLTD